MGFGVCLEGTHEKCVCVCVCVSVFSVHPTGHFFTAHLSVPQLHLLLFTTLLSTSCVCARSPPPPFAPLFSSFNSFILIPFSTFPFSSLSLLQYSPPSLYSVILIPSPPIHLPLLLYPHPSSSLYWYVVVVCVCVCVGGGGGGYFLLTLVCVRAGEGVFM